MRFKINLASQPYQNARRFFTQWTIALVALFVVSGLLVYAAARSWRISHSLTRSISDERARLDKLNAQEKADLEILNKDRNRDVRERSQAINALILRKEFSWTRIFSDLEKILPARLHVTSITPTLTQMDQIEIRMQMGGDSREKAIEFLQNMEKAADFRDTRLISETASARGNGGDSYTFEFSSFYVPAAAAAISEAEKNAATTQPQPGAATDQEPKAESPEPRAAVPQRPATSDQRPTGGPK